MILQEPSFFYRTQDPFYWRILSCE